MSSIIKFFLATDDEEAAGMSPDLVTDLAEADEARLAEIRSHWIQLQSLDDEELDSVTAGELLAEIAGLAVLAGERGHGVYSWWY